MFKRDFWLGFLGLVLLAAGLRFYRLGQIPVALYWDEVAIMVDAKSVAETGLDMHGRPWYQVLYPSYGDYKQPVYIWLTALSFKLFGASEWALRVPSALAGVGTVVTGGWLARKLLEKRFYKPSDKGFLPLTQLTTMLVITLSPWSILFSRAAFEGHLGQFFLVLAILLLTYQKKHQAWLVISVMLAALATYSYFSVRFVWPMVFFIYQLIDQPWSIKNKQWQFETLGSWLKIYGLNIVLPLFFYGLLLIPMFWSPFYAASNQFRLSTSSIFNSQDYALQSNTYRELAGNTVFDRLFFHRRLLLLRELADNLADNFSLQFIFINGDQNLRHGTGQHGLFLVVWLPLLLTGLYLFYHRYQRLLLFLSLWVIMAALPASVPQDTPHALRFLNALVPLSIVIGLGLAGFLKKVNLFPKIISRPALAVTCLVVLLTAGQFGHYYFQIYPSSSSEAWLSGYKEAAQTYVSQVDRIDEFYWELADDKFYLWLLAYGNLPSSDIQHLKTNQFLVDINQFEKYQQEVFLGFSAAGGNVQKVIVVTRPERLSELENLAETTLVSSEHLSNQIVLAELERTHE